MSQINAGIADELAAGKPAPEFKLNDQFGRSHELAGHRGKWVVLYFYPRDDTPGCTKEACNFRDDIQALDQMGAQILGVSLDSAKSHAKFAEKYGLPFPLLADTDGSVARQYGAVTGFGPLKFAKRHTFIIDPEGKVARIYRKVSPAEHSQQVITDIKALVDKE